jgi:hypothetical protein
MGYQVEGILYDNSFLYFNAAIREKTYRDTGLPARYCGNSVVLGE